MTYLSEKKSVAIVGAKSFPNTYGGFESLLECLLINDDFSGHFSEIVVPVERADSIEVASGIRFELLDVEKSKNPFSFYFKSLLRARDVDAVIILGLGAGFWLPIFRIVWPNKRLVVNVDGLEWRRDKFSLAKRSILFLLAIFNIIFASRLIFDNSELVSRFPLHWLVSRSKINHIAYSSRFESLMHCDMQKRNAEKYVLSIARFVPENNIELICKAYTDSEVSGRAKLIFVGDVENYGSDLRAQYPKVHFTGPIYDLQEVYELMRDALCYVHGHTVGGTNPVLVEAIHCNLRIFCHDNAFNRSTTCNAVEYFTTHLELSNLLTALDVDVPQSGDFCSLYDDRYSGSKIASEYRNVALT